MLSLMQQCIKHDKLGFVELALSSAGAFPALAATLYLEAPYNDR